MPVLTPVESINRLSANAAALAETVSLAIRIEPQLLRKMRLDLFPTFDAGVEADLWFSPVVESRASSGIVLQQLAAHVLRQRLGKKPALLEAAWRVIEPLHRKISPAIFAEERLAYLTLAEKYDEMRELLRSVVATLVSPRGRGLADWAAKAIDRLPQEARTFEEAQMLAFGASLRLGLGGARDSGVPSVRAAKWAAWLSPDDLETQPFGVALLEDAVEFGPVGRPRSHRIELPKTTPVVVEVGWHDGTREWTERTTLNPYGVTIVEFGPGVTQVDIRTVLGDSYWLTVPAPRERESRQKKIGRVRPPRVRITYDVELGGAIEQKELPFVVGVLANLSGSQTATLPSLRDRKFVEVDRDNFDQVMKAMNPRLTLRVENRMEEDGVDLHVELRFDAIADFEPTAVARQTGSTRELLEKRTLLAEIRSMLVGNQKLEDELEKVLTGISRSQSVERPASRLAPGFPAAVEAVENAAKVSPDRAQELVATFVENVFFPSGSKDVEAAANARIPEIDARLSEQVSAILHDPNFQALESTWRGLSYLVMQTETSVMLKIRVWNVDKRGLAQDLAAAAEFDQCTTFKKIYEEPFGTFGGEPFGLLLGAYEFGQSPDDVELLARLSAIAAASHAPFVAAANAEILHLESFADLGNPRDISKIFDSPEAEKWNSFRESEDSRYVGLTLPRILLRLPYGKDTVPVEEFSFEEGVRGSDHSGYLWGSAAFALAARITDAFATYGWCVAIRGVEGGGLVEGLPVHTFMTDNGDVASKCPTEIAISDRRELELSRAGFIPLCHYRGTDYAVFLSLNSVQKPRRYASEEAEVSARLSVQLPYMLAVSRFAHYLKCMMRDKIGSFMSRGDAEIFLNRWIANFVLADDGAPAVEKARRPLREARIDIEEVKDRPGAYRAIAYLRPQFQLDELTVSLRVVIDPGNTRR
jgi:type VI secretion system protein ImpC